MEQDIQTTLLFDRTTIMAYINGGQMEMGSQMYYLLSPSPMFYSCSKKDEGMDKEEPKFVCMIAGKDNYGKERNPMWGTCRKCCSYCIDCGTLHKYLLPKCNTLSCDFCAWRCTLEELVFIDIFGEEYGREIYKENVKRRDKMVSNSSSTTTDLP